mmetsp:Transcript_101185/g.285273  ORF Transcript_101185/g.285273 Transcript_101185/m.285273 type:complete len:82 (-) Transcript_101185:125-370(-)
MKSRRSRKAHSERELDEAMFHDLVPNSETAGCSRDRGDPWDLQATLDDRDQQSAASGSQLPSENEAAAENVSKGSSTSEGT